jgi:hypothetical protein
MHRHLVCLPALAGTLLLGTTAHAEQSELQDRVLVTAQVYSSLHTGLDFPESGPENTTGFVYPGANLGFRIGIGQGRWASDPRVYLGHMANGGDFVSGYTVGLWGRNGSPSPSIEERHEAAYGLSFTHYGQTEKGRLMVNTVEGGVRFSVREDGLAITSSGDPLGQAVLGYTTQSLVMDNVLFGPSMELRIGNEQAPWGAQFGIRLSI